MTAHVMIRLNAEDLPPEGIPVVYRLGEQFEGKIEWEDPVSGQLRPSARCNDRGEPGLCIDELDENGFAGFEAKTGTYWRYEHESDPEVFREYCMQILEIGVPFVPRSSWTAWHMLNLSLGPERLRVDFKNSVTGTELSYKLINRGIGYQIKDLSEGRRTQKMLKHDFVLNQLLGTSFKKLDHHKVKIETCTEGEDDDRVATFCARFLREQLMLRYRIDGCNFSVALFDIAEQPETLIRLVEVPHSNVVADTRTFLG